MQLFMKIDADAGGTVDWDEFSNYMFLKKADNDEDSAACYRLFPAVRCRTFNSFIYQCMPRTGNSSLISTRCTSLQELPGRTDNTGTHSDLIERVVHVPEVDKYITCSRDATFRIWNSADLKHSRTLVNGLRWVNDAAYMPSQRKLVVASMDRSLNWYDVNRGSYESIGRYA